MGAAQPCARCRQVKRTSHHFEGPICRSCFGKAVRTRGRCQGCGTERLLPGRNENGAAVCRDCAGLDRDFSCTRCLHEGDLWPGRLCERCTLHDLVAGLLADADGQPQPFLVPVVAALLDTDRPRSRLLWVRSPHVSRLLGDLAAGRVPLSHDGLDTAPARTATLLRDLLMDTGALPGLDRQLLLYQRWLADRLAMVHNPEHRQLLQRFDTWHVSRRLRTKAAKEPLSQSQIKYARNQISQAAALLEWLCRRGLDLRRCTQPDLEAWHQEHSNTAAQMFLRWSMQNGRIPKLKRAAQAPAGRPQAAPPRVPEGQLARVLRDEDLPRRTRVAGALVLLYAQPVTRIVKLTTEHIADDGAALTIRLGEPSMPVPEPVAGLIRDYLNTDHHRLPYASARSRRWLFPGRQAGQPMTARALQTILRDAGIAPGVGRAEALRRFVAHTPPPVAAKALGYTDFTTEQAATDIGATWSRYAAGERR